MPILLWHLLHYFHLVQVIKGSKNGKEFNITKGNSANRADSDSKEFFLYLVKHARENNTFSWSRGHKNSWTAQSRSILLLLLFPSRPSLRCGNDKPMLAWRTQWQTEASMTAGIWNRARRSRGKCSIAENRVGSRYARVPMMTCGKLEIPTISWTKLSPETLEKKTWLSWPRHHKNS